MLYVSLREVALAGSGAHLLTDPASYGVVAERGGTGHRNPAPHTGTTEGGPSGAAVIGGGQPISHDGMTLRPPFSGGELASLET